ncbi:MAG: hypothetical protein WCF19_06315 [Chlamydiales bacterium]
MVPGSASVEQNPYQSLQRACKQKHIENGVYGSKLITVALLIASLIPTLLLGPLIGIPLGAALYFLAGERAHSYYNEVRNQDFRQIEQALDTAVFQHHLDAAGQVSIDNILAIYKQFVQTVMTPTECT